MVSPDFASEITMLWFVINHSDLILPAFTFIVTNKYACTCQRSHRIIMERKVPGNLVRKNRGNEAEGEEEEGVLFSGCI